MQSPDLLGYALPYMDLTDMLLMLGLSDFKRGAVTITTWDAIKFEFPQHLLV